ENFYVKSRNSIETGRKESVAGYVIPARQRDMTRAAQLQRSRGRSRRKSRNSAEQVAAADRRRPGLPGGADAGLKTHLNGYVTRRRCERRKRQRTLHNEHRSQEQIVALEMRAAQGLAHSPDGDAEQEAGTSGNQRAQPSRRARHRHR